MSCSAPFPWFGGKSLVAPLVWPRFGADVPNYVEPFFGSGAVLLARPGGAGSIETVNDLDGFVCNAWRALAADPDAVARYADWPVNENDLHARHAWLKPQRETLSRRLEGDPDYYDAKLAGWWLWGMACWIGGGFCGDSGSGPWSVVDGQLVRDAGVGVKRKRLSLQNGGKGVARKRVHLTGVGIRRKLVHLGNAGQGIARTLVRLGDADHSHACDDCGTGICGLKAWFRALQTRLARVRVCCGDFERILGPTPTTCLRTTAVFLDPPYAPDTGRDMGVYNEDQTDVSARARAWAIEHGDDPDMRIALCGYADEHPMPDSWDCMAWKAHGGYSNQSASENRHRERIWFSPYCLQPDSAPNLFDEPSWNTEHPLAATP